MNATPSQPVNSPSAHEIAVCAYAIWDQEGRPHGRDMEHWLQAKAQLEADRRHDLMRSVNETIEATLVEHRARRLRVFRKRAATNTGRPRVRPQAVLV
jgi:hypothetical protein